MPYGKKGRFTSKLINKSESREFAPPPPLTLSRSISMTIYLYVKTHNITGLKYLGQTKKEDPFLYQGSGKYWKQHINKHGYNVDTAVLFESDSMDEIAHWGKYYSALWDVVRSNEWANLKPEVGAHGWTPHFGSEHPMFDHTIYHFIHDDGTEIQCTRQDFIQEFKLSAGNVHTLIHGSWIVYNGWRLYKNKDIDYRKFKSMTNGRYDHTVYKFKHECGITECCTQRELRFKYPELRQGHTSALARGDRRSYKGWRLSTADPAGSVG
jgi:hypothetical protein